MDDNADRAGLPGQQPVPERDIEPLWPPDPADAVPHWAGEPAPVYPPTAYPSLAAEVTPTPPDGGWAPPGYDGQLDLDLPFTLDPSLAGPPSPPAGPAPGPGQATHTNPPNGLAHFVPPARPGHGSGLTDGTDPTESDLEGSPPSAGPEPPGIRGAGPDPTSDATGVAAVSAPHAGRGESPWALPPQRLSGGADEPGRAEGPRRAEVVPAAAVHPYPAPTAPPPLPPTSPPALPAAPGPTASAPTGPGPVDPGSTRPESTGGTGPVPPPQQSPGGWYRPSWPEQPAPVGATPPASPDPAALTGYPELGWSPESGVAPTAEDFARRRQIRPAEPIATMGVRAMVNRIGLVKLPPGQHEQELKRDIEMVRRNFGGLRQVTVVNPKGGAGKTVAILLLAMTFGQKRGGYVLAWDNNETQGTLGMRAQQDFHSRTVRDMLRDLGQFQGPHGRIGDLSQYVRSQGEGMFDVLASDESATGGEMLTAAAFAEIREVVSRFYKLIFVDTGNNVRAQNWQAAMDATDQLVVTMSARNDSAETAARMLDHLEQSGRHRLVRQAVTVVSMPPSRKEIDLPAIQEHFAARTRAVLLAPYERLIDTGEPIRYGGLSSATRDAWLKIAAAVAEGL
ncbi:chromosome partitioning protein [Micromonospora sp. NBC_00421]|uniref:MinD/ParA family ATP-binding protein n=1 Tax=Micromonospora sp. NBC_00421 TaxID=2975976 RepID=UPI003FA54F0B